MGNTHPKPPKDPFSVEDDGSAKFRSTPPEVILARVPKILEEGKIALIEEDFEAASTAFRYAYGLVDMYIDADFVAEKSKQKLREANFKISCILYKLQVREYAYEQTQKPRNYHQKPEGQVFSMQDLHVPSHIEDELKSKGNSKLSEEAAAFKRLVDNIEVSIPDITLKDIVGQQEAVQAIKNKILHKRRRPWLYKKAHVQGIMFFGPPGNGKTMIAKAVADLVGGSEIKFFKVSVSNFLSKWHGETEITISSLFKLAHLNGPSVIFIDEVDALFKSRSSDKGMGSTGTGFVQLFLDMVSSYKNVFILCATNYPWLIDAAFYRRFKPIHIKMPTRKDRLDMLKVLFKGVDHTLLRQDFEDMATRSEGFSFDDVNIIVEDMAEMAQDFAHNCNYFRLTNSKSGFTGTWTPCLKAEEGARKITFEEIPEHHDIAHVPITKAIAEKCLQKYTPTVDEATIRQHEVFNANGLKGMYDAFSSTAPNQSKDN